MVDAVGALLPAKALEGQRIGISVSESPDLARLGLLELHFKLALRELARTVLVGGGTLAYGGHLQPGGYTEFLVGELHQYASLGGLAGGMFGVPALLVCLAENEHRRFGLAELDEKDAELGTFGAMRCLDREGRVLADRSAGRLATGEPITDTAALTQGLTALRRYLTSVTSARLFLGGKRHGYSGRMPGLVEETLMAVEAGQPVFFAAGFGGVTLDIACAIDPQCGDLCPRHADDPPLDAATQAGLKDISALVGARSWGRLANGLDDLQNRRLARTHRPAEIAALVALGLGRARCEAAAP